MQNKKGNAAVIALIVVIVAITASAITWKFATKTQAPVANGVPETQLPRVDTQTTPTPNNMTQYFEVKELGLKFPVDATLAMDIAHTVKDRVENKKTIQTVTFSSKKLRTQTCADEVTLVKFPGEFTDYPDLANRYAKDDFIIFPNAFILVGGPQESCFSDKKMQDDSFVFVESVMSALKQVVLMDVDTMPVAVTSGFQKKNEKAVVGNGIDVYFENGIESLDATGITFNPKDKQQSGGGFAPGDSYNLITSDALSAQEVSQKALKSDTNTQKPVTKTINGLTVVESADGGFCDTRFAEVIGKKNNYVLSSLGCAHDAKTDFAAFEQVIATIKFVE